MSMIEEQQELSDWLSRVKAASEVPVVYEPTGLSIPIEGGRVGISVSQKEIFEHTPGIRGLPLDDPNRLPGATFEEQPKGEGSLQGLLSPSRAQPQIEIKTNKKTGEKFPTFKAEDTALVQATREEQQNLRTLKDDPSFVGPLQRGLWGTNPPEETFFLLSEPASSLTGKSFLKFKAEQGLNSPRRCKMSNQPQETRKTFYQHLQEHRATFTAVGCKLATAEDPIYRQGGYMIHFTAPIGNLSETSPTEENSPQK